MKFRSLLIDYYAEAKILLREVLEAAGQQDTVDSRDDDAAVSTWPPVDECHTMEGSTPCEVAHDSNGANVVTVQDTIQSNTDDQAFASFDYGDLYSHPELLMETYETSGKPWTSPARKVANKNENEAGPNDGGWHSPSPAETCTVTTTGTRTDVQVAFVVAVTPACDQSWLGRLLVLFFHHMRMKWIQHVYPYPSPVFHVSLSRIKLPPVVDVSWFGGLVLQAGIIVNAIEDEKTGNDFDGVHSSEMPFDIPGCASENAKERCDENPATVWRNHTQNTELLPCIEQVQRDDEAYKKQILMTAVVAGYCAWKHHSSQVSESKVAPESLKLPSIRRESLNPTTTYHSPHSCEATNTTNEAAPGTNAIPPEVSKRKASWSATLPRFSKRAIINLKRFDSPVTRQTSCQQRESTILRRFGLFQQDQTTPPELQAQNRQTTSSSKRHHSQTTAPFQDIAEDSTNRETFGSHMQSRVPSPFESTVEDLPEGNSLSPRSPLPSLPHTNPAFIDDEVESFEDMTLPDNGKGDIVGVSSTRVIGARDSVDKYDDAELSESAKLLLRALDEGQNLGAPPRADSRRASMEREDFHPHETRKDRKRRRKEEKRLHKQQKKERKRQKRLERDAKNQSSLSPQSDCNETGSDSLQKVPLDHNMPKQSVSSSEVGTENSQQWSKQDSTAFKLEVGSCHAKGTEQSDSKVNETKVLCSERFVESWGDLIASLASGEEARFVFVDTNLLDWCEVDIETGSWGGIVIIRLSDMQEQGVSTLIRKVVNICAMSRYTTLTVFVVSDDEWGAEVLDFTRLQNTTLHQTTHTTTRAAIHLVSQKSLAARLAGTIGDGSPPTGTKLSFEAMEMLVTNQKMAEKLIFLISLVPSLSIGAAAEILQWLEDVGSTMQALLGRNDAIRNALERSYAGNQPLLRAITQITFAVSTPLRSM